MEIAYKITSNERDPLVVINCDSIEDAKNAYSIHYKDEPIKVEKIYISEKYPSMMKSCIVSYNDITEVKNESKTVVKTDVLSLLHISIFIMFLFIGYFLSSLLTYTDEKDLLLKSKIFLVSMIISGIINIIVYAKSYFNLK